MTTVKTTNTTLSISQRMTAGLVCVLLGASMVFLVGMSGMSAAHNAAHDTRHSIGFPCH